MSWPPSATTPSSPAGHSAILDHPLHELFPGLPRRKWKRRPCGEEAHYTWSVVHRNDLPPGTDRTPYTAAVVDLAEGPRMVTEIVRAPVPHGGAEPELSPCPALEVAFREGGPVFRVAGTGRPQAR
jgi:hypothetical protein